jgi:hypothetical protein
MAGGGSRPSWRSIPGTSSWCHSSASLPPDTRKISWPVMVTGRPVGGSPNKPNGPVLVPVMVHRPATNSPSDSTASAVNFRSGKAFLTMAAAQSCPARPAGLAVSRPAATGRRRSTVYEITPAGREALTAWLAEPGTGMVLECEALVKIAYADQGTRAGRLANLDALIEETTAKLAFGDAIARQYLAGDGPFPERLPYSGLMWRILWDYHQATARWARWARDEVRAWPEDLSQLDAAAEFARIVAAAGTTWPADPAQADKPGPGAAPAAG